ncbi:membrane-associating domain-containing protein [Lipomyces doorenjongii]
MSVKGLLHIMAMNIAANRTVDFALRALQLIFAIIVMGTDGYAIHVFRGHTVHEYFEFGNFYDYYGVPDAWGFLMFCAAWTFLGVIFLLIAGISFADHALIGYIRVAVEAVALLSWLAGFIAVAVNIGSNHSPAKDFYDQSRYTYLIGGIGPPWTSEPSDALRTIGSLAIDWQKEPDVDISALNHIVFKERDPRLHTKGPFIT